MLIARGLCTFRSTWLDCLLTAGDKEHRSGARRPRFCESVEDTKLPIQVVIR
jgi:hypothetical protein